jgi:hypothetical protein
MLAVDQLMVLGEELVPPPGYEPDALLAATYSLDPVLALALPLAFVRHGRFAGEAIEGSDPYALMEAIRRFAPRYRVFHDASGLLTVPRGQRRMLNLLGEVIVPVSLGLSAAHATFHPKFVLARFTAPGSHAGDLLRLICMSRNLTGSAALDISCVLEAREGSQPKGDPSSRRLADAIEELLAWSVHQPPDLRTRALVEELAAATRRSAWQAPAGFRAVRIWPLGFGEESSDPAAPQPGDERVLVISPFLDDRRLRSLAAGRSNNVLISSEDALATIPPETLALFDVKTLDHTRTPANGLHAKVYVVHGARARRWIIGSANATNAAAGRNAELIVELETAVSGAGIDDVLDYEEGIGSIILDRLAPTDEEQVAEAPRHTRAEELLRHIAACRLAAVVEADEGQAYQVTITLDPPVELADAVVMVAMADERWEPLDPERAPAARLRRVARTDLSPFLRVQVKADGDTHQRLLVLELNGVDVHDLADEALADLIREDETLNPLEYLRRLLMGEEGGAVGLSFDDDDLATEDESMLGDQAASSAAGHVLAAAPMLEAMLAALADDASGGQGGALLADVASVVEGFRDQLPSDFLELWQLIQSSRRSST